MNIKEVIEKYIELSMQKESIERIIGNSRVSIEELKIKADGAFYSKDHEAEKKYDNSIDYYRSVIVKNIDKLSKVSSDLRQMDQRYNNMASNMDGSALIEVATSIRDKETANKILIGQLEEKREYVLAEGNKAYENGDLNKENGFDKIHKECIAEIDKLTTQNRYYESFVIDLSYRSGKYMGSGLSK